MPSRVEAIDCIAPTYFTVAQFLAILAFPTDKGKERRFCHQLALWFLEYYATLEQRDVLISAPLFLFKLKPETQVFEQGIEKLWDRFWVGINVILPDTTFSDQEDHLESLTSLLKDAMSNMGIRNLSTAKTKLWKPSWPVFHAAASFALHIHSVTERMSGSKEKVSFAKLIFTLMMQTEVEKELVSVAEKVRTTVLEKKLYPNLREEHSIQFELVNPSAKKASFDRSGPLPEGDALDPLGEVETTNVFEGSRLSQSRSFNQLWVTFLQRS